MGWSRSTGYPLAEPASLLSGCQVGGSTDRTRQTRGTQWAESSTGSGEDLGLYLGLYFRVLHCRTPSHRAWQELCESEDSCLSTSNRWLAVSPIRHEGSSRQRQPPPLATLARSLLVIRNMVQRSQDPAPWGQLAC